MIWLGRQPLDLAAVFGAADRRAPAGLGEGVGETSPEHVGRVHPRVVVVGHGLGVPLLVEFDLLEVELIDHLRVFAIWEPRQRPRHRQHHEPGIVGIAEAPPLRVGLVEKDLLEVAGLRQLGEAVHAEELRRGGRDERTETSRRDLRHLRQQVDVFRVVRELVVADQGTVGLAARRAELGLVDLLEGLALVELVDHLRVLAVREPRE